MTRLIPILVLVSPAPFAARADELVGLRTSRLTLRPQATVRGETVRLGDVLSFADADPRLDERLSDVPLAEDLKPPTTVEISYDSVRALLERSRVNLSRVLVSGALVCRVSVEARAPQNVPPTRVSPSTSQQVDRAAPIFRDAGASAGARLEDVLRARLDRELSELGGKAEVEFESAGQEFLDLTSPPFEFSVREDRGPKLGLRQFTVSIRRDNRMLRTARIGAMVKLIREVLVAAGPLNAGNTVRRDSLKFARRVITSERNLGLNAVEQVVGRRVKKYVADGSMIHTENLQDVELVRRSRPVTVTSDGPVQIRVTGVALDSGGYGQQVRVRIGDPRKRRIIRGVITGVGTVRMQEAG